MKHVNSYIDQIHSTMFSCVRQKSDDYRTQATKCQQYKCDVELTLYGMEGVTLSNGVLFAKVRLLSGGQFCRYSSRREIRDNRVTWSSNGCSIANSNGDAEEPSEPKLQFSCRLPGGVLRISVRKEEKGGRSYSKLGFVNIYLASVGCRNRTEQKAFILTPYSPNQRLDNSTLRLSLCLRCDAFFNSETSMDDRQQLQLLKEIGSSPETPPTLPQLQLQPVTGHAVYQHPQASPLSLPLLFDGNWRRQSSDCSSNFSASGQGLDSRAGSLGRDSALIGQSSGISTASQASACRPSLCSADTGGCLPVLAAERKRLGCWTAAGVRGDLPERIVSTRANNQVIVQQVLQEQGITIDALLGKPAI